MLKIVGVQRMGGEFQGKPYDNLYLHCLNDAPSKPTIAGDVCETLKIKWAEKSQVFGGLVETDSDLRALIGSAATPFYDRFGRVLRVEIGDYISRGGGGKV